MSSYLPVTRRKALVVGAGLLIAANCVATSQAKKVNPGEQANLKLVNDFLKGWAAADATGAGLAAFFTDDCTLRLQEGKPPILGKAAVTAAFDGYLSKGSRYAINILESCAKGPIVINSRTDAAIVDGAPGKATPVVGFFLVRNGKIAEQSDFLP